jgi:hypothetical protein
MLVLSAGLLILQELQLSPASIEPAAYDAKPNKNTIESRESGFRRPMLELRLEILSDTKQNTIGMKRLLLLGAVPVAKRGAQPTPCQVEHGTDCAMSIAMENGTASHPS